MVFAYVLWLILPRLTTSEIIGISSTIVSVTIIFSTIIDLGISTGSARFLGKSFYHKIGDIRILVNASLLITGVSIVVSNFIILIFREWLLPGISFDLIVISIFLIDISVIYNLLRSILISSLKTNSLPKIMSISSIIRIVLTIALVLIGAGAIGITVGYLLGYVSGVIFITLVLVTILSRTVKNTVSNLSGACKKIIIASIPSLVPKVIGVLGTNLGTVLVFGAQGAGQAGSFFIAFSIFYAIATIRESLFTVAFPVLNAMEDKRKAFVSKLTKMSLIISLPISSVLWLYSDDVMGLFGPYYIQSSLSLKIMLLSMLPSTFAAGVSSLVYSYGDYWKVLAVGIGLNFSRVIFYFIFVPLYGDTGAAISIAFGSLIGFGVSAFIARSVGMLVFWRQLALLFAIPILPAILLEHFHANPIIGVPLVLVLSFGLYYISQVLTKSDMRTSLELLPQRISKPLIDKLDKL